MMSAGLAWAPTGRTLDLYPLRKNRLRECLDRGLPSLGTHLLSTWPTITELVGQTGHFDYVEFVAEYAPWTMHDLDNLGRAIELFPDFSGMIKIEQDTRGHLAMRAIGFGHAERAVRRRPDGGGRPPMRAFGAGRAP